MQIINLTPHAIVLAKSDGSQKTIPATTPSARIQQQNVVCHDVDGIPVSGWSMAKLNIRLIRNLRLFTWFVQWLHNNVDIVMTF